MRKKLIGIVSALILIGFVAGAGYAIWTVYQLISQGSVVGTMSFMDLEGSMDNVTWSSALPQLFDQANMVPGDAFNNTWYVRAIGDAPASMGTLVTNLVQTEGNNPEGADDVDQLAEYLEIGYYQVNGNDAKASLVDSNANGYLDLDDLTYADQNIGFINGASYKIAFLLRPETDDLPGLHGDSITFDIEFQAVP